MSAHFSKPDARSLDLWWRIVAVAAACASSALAAPVWLAAPLVTVAALGAVQSMLRQRRNGWVDAIAVGTGGLLAALILTGLFLDVLPVGLTPVSWAVAAGVLALLSVLWGSTGPGATPLGLRGRLRGLRSAPWYVAAAALVIVAVTISVHASDVSERPPVQLSMVGSDRGNSATVLVTGGRERGSYELVADDGTGADVRVGPFTLGAQDSVRYDIPTTVGLRTTIALRVAGSTRTLRSLILQPRSAR